MRRYSITALSFVFTVLGAILKWWGGIVDIFNFSKDTKAMVDSVPQFEADWGLYIFLLGLFGLTLSFVIPMSKKCFQRTVETDNPKSSSGTFAPEVETKAPPLDRQPINLAYKHLIRVGRFEEDGNDALQIANLLRQAALDGEISIWGSEPSSMPVEWQAPFLIEIDRDYWRHHGIDPVRLMHDASEFPGEGCKTERESPPWNAQIECYWHLHVDMNQVGSIWRKQTRPDNE